MSELHDVGDIQIDEDLSFLRKEWRFQRLGWVAMLLFVILGLAGALGHGPLSKASAGDPATFAISFDRIIRHSSHTQLVLTAGKGLDGDTLRVFITARYLHGFEVRDIVPQPAASGVRGGYVYYDFLRETQTRASEIVFNLDTKGYGAKRAVVFTRGAAPLHVHQSILP